MSTRAFTSALLLFAATAPAARAHGEACKLDPDEAFSRLEKASGLACQLQAATAGNMQEFCAKETFRGVGALMFDWSAAKADRYRKAPETLVDFFQTRPDDSGSWELNTFPSEKTAQRAFELRYASGLGCARSLDDTRKILAQKARPLAPERLDKINTVVEEVRSKGTEDETLAGARGMAEKLAVCSLLSVSSSFHCARGLDQIRQLMTQRLVDTSKGLFNFGVLPVMKEVLTDARYAEGLRLAALKLDRRLGDRSLGTDANLFEDLRSSFEASGLGARDSLEFTWNALAVISSGGASTFIRLFHLDHDCAPPNAVAEALTHLSLAAPLLDVRSAGSGHLYSYPPNVRTSCNQGKSYHFWMSAFLARRVARETGDAEAGSAAAYTAEKGYQATTSVGYRTSWRAFTVDTFDPFNNVSRMDLAYAAAGAIFGAGSVDGTSTKSLNVDEGLRTLLRHARLTSKMPRADAEELVQDKGKTFLKWSSIFAPDSVYSEFDH